MTVRYAGRLGRLQPDPHRRGVRPERRAPGPDPARPVDDGAGRARPHRGRRRPESCRRSASSSAGWAGWARRSSSRAPSARPTTAIAIVDSEAEQAGQRIIRARRGGDRRSELDVPQGAAGRPTYNQPRADRPPGAGAAQGRRGIPRGRHARGLQGAGGRSPVGPVDDPPRARQPRGARACSPIRTPPPAASRPRPATATSSTGCCRPRTRGPAAVAVAGAPRARRGDAGHDRDAVAGHQPAGDRHRSADRDLDDPPRRGAAAAAAGADGRGDHLDRRRHQAAVHVRAPDRPRARRLGGQLSERAARRPRARRPDAARSGCTTRRCRDAEREFLDALAPVFTELEESRSGRPVRRGHLAPAARRALRRRVRAQLADGHARAPRSRCSGCCAPRSPSATCWSGSAPRTTRPRCARWRWWPPATGCRSASSARCR